MENYRQKAVSLVGEQQIQNLEHAFYYWTDVRMRLIFQASCNWSPFDFFCEFLEESEAVPEEVCQSYYKLNAQGIELSECLSIQWSKCEPIDTEDA